MIGQSQLQHATKNIQVLGFGVPYIKGLAVDRELSIQHILNVAHGPV